MPLFHIPQCSIQNRNAHISVLNGALGYGAGAFWDLWNWSIRLTCCNVAYDGWLSVGWSAVREKSGNFQTRQKLGNFSRADVWSEKVNLFINLLSLVWSSVQISSESHWYRTDALFSSYKCETCDKVMHSNTQKTDPELSITLLTYTCLLVFCCSCGARLCQI